MRMKVMNSFMLLVCGIGIGWLAGLSVSPVIAQILSSLLGMVAALVAVLCGIEWPPGRRGDAIADQSPPEPSKSLSRHLASLNALPIAVVIAGLVGGSLLGMTARTHDWFGMDPAREAEQWTRLGLEKKYVAKILLHNKYAWASISPSDGDGSMPNLEATASAVRKNVMATGLLGTRTSACEGLSGLIDLPDAAGLRRELRTSPFLQFGKLEAALADDDALREVIRILCNR